MTPKLNKYFPYLLIAATILIGIVIFYQKGILVIPSAKNQPGSNSTVVNKPAMIDVLFTGKEYKLSYAETPVSDYINIAKFDKNEAWQGVGSVEEDERVLGGAVLSLADRSRQKANAYLIKNLNLSGIDVIKFNIDFKTFPDDLEVINVIFGDRSLSNFYRYPISNLKQGINYMTIAKSRFFLVQAGKTVEAEVNKAEKSTGALDWGKIERVEFELISRPDAKTSVDIGWIRGEKDDLYTGDWNWDSNEHFFNLDQTQEGKGILLVQNTTNSLATLKKIGSTKDFDYSVKITSSNRGKLGLFFRGDYKTGYGYYLAVEGLGTNVWSVYKYNLEDNQAKTSILLNGQISNFEFSKNQPFWLKVTAKGNKILAYFSPNGKDYTKLGEVSDNDFGAGGVGILASGGGNGYFDEFYLTQ